MPPLTSASRKVALAVAVIQRQNQLQLGTARDQELEYLRQKVEFMQSAPSNELLSSSQPVPSIPACRAVVDWLDRRAGSDPRATVESGLGLLRTMLAPVPAGTGTATMGTEAATRVLKQVLQCAKHTQDALPSLLAFAAWLCDASASAFAHARLRTVQRLLEVLGLALGHPVLCVLARATLRAVERAQKGASPEHAALASQPIFGAFQHVLEAGLEQAVGGDEHAGEWLQLLQAAHDEACTLAARDAMPILSYAVWHLSTASSHARDRVRARPSPPQFDLLPRATPYV